MSAYEAMCLNAIQGYKASLKPDEKDEWEDWEDTVLLYTTMEAPVAFYQASATKVLPFDGSSEKSQKRAHNLARKRLKARVYQKLQDDGRLPTGIGWWFPVSWVVSALIGEIVKWLWEKWWSDPARANNCLGIVMTTAASVREGFDYLAEE